MTIIEAIKAFVHDHLGETLDSQEIKRSVKKECDRAECSIIPSDYCYNRVNDGSCVETNPLLFEFLGKGMYRCVGENYPYDGVVYHKPKGSAEIPVGRCVAGRRMIARDLPFEGEASRDAIPSKTAHKTTRMPGDRMRFKVLKADHFKCRLCGASPAKDPSVELHVDHVVPWSKGGETLLENLQTLCQKCNCGKSDLCD